MIIVVLMLLGTGMWVAGYALLNITRAWGNDVALDRHADDDETLLEVQELLSRKTMLMQLIQHTTIDMEMGRIEESDAKALIRRYKRETVRVMKDLDALQGEPQDIERAIALVDARADQEAERIERQEEAWSPAALKRHAGVAPGQNE